MNSTFGITSKMEETSILPSKTPKLRDARSRFFGDEERERQIVETRQGETLDEINPFLRDDAAISPDMIMIIDQ